MSQYQPIPGTPKEILRAIRILFAAIIAGAAIFALVILGINKMDGPGMPELKGYKNIFLYVVAAIAAICLPAAFNSYNKGITAAKESLIPLTGKLNMYRAALVRYIALCEAPALLGIIALFVTGNYVFLIIAAIMIVAMLVKAPTRRRVIDDLALDWKQQQELE